MSAAKVHVAVGYERSLCGLSPRGGGYDIRSMATFFQSAEKDQCCRCVDLLSRRGYSIKRLREAAVPMPRSHVVADRGGAHAAI